MKNKAEKIFNKFYDFTDGVRIIFLVLRHKDGGKGHLRQQYKKISRNREEFEEILNDFVKKKQEAKEDYRIYSSINSRNTYKAIKVFKENQLAADYYGEKERDDFYHDSRNRWISALMRRRCSNESDFLIDVDTKDKEKIKIAKERIASIIGRNFFMYETKNGYHMVTPPFNQALFKAEDCEIQKDSLILLDY